MLAAAAALALLWAAPARAQQASTGPLVESVSIRRRNVFDLSVPGEDWWPFRAANRIHVLSRESVIRREVLLPAGSRWDELKAIETERNLRSLGFIRSAEFRIDPSSGAAVLTTQDSWTLAPQFSVGTEGGDDFLIYGIEEKNLLGWGKTVSAFRSQIGSDIRNEARYKDPRILGTRFRMTSLYAQTPRGDETGVQFERPFFSLDTVYAARLSWARVIEEEILYADAVELSKFIDNGRTVNAELGLRAPYSAPGLVQRMHLGWLYEDYRFDATDKTLAGTLPQDRELSGPMAGYSWVRPDYVKETFINSMKRVEDFNMGNELSLRAGPLLEAFGSDRDRWFFQAVDQQGLWLSPGRFLLGQVGARGRLSRGHRPEDGIFFTNLNIFWKSRWPFANTFVSHLEANTTKNLDGEHQLLLGGDTGLRGYKNNSFTGRRSVLFNVEDRFFRDREYLHLVYLGGVVFFDAGAVADHSGRLSKFYKDVGFGLRVSPSRSTSGGVLRIDAAYGLNRGPGGNRWVVSIRGGQAFSVFNSTNRKILRPADAALSEDGVGSRLRRR